MEEAELINLDIVLDDDNSQLDRLVHGQGLVHKR